MEADLKKTILTEYKAIVAAISEAHATMKHLNPRQEALAKLIETYGWGPEIEALAPDDDVKNNTEESRFKGAKIATLSKEFFVNNRNQWTRLSDLFLYLTEQGLSIGGKNPSSTLSAHLSNSDMFESDRARGWRLRPEQLRPAVFEGAAATGEAGLEYLK